MPTYRLADLDGCRVAILLRSNAVKRILLGTAVFLREENQREILRIRANSDEPGSPVIEISDADWEGQIIKDTQHGCDFYLEP